MTTASEITMNIKFSDVAAKVTAAMERLRVPGAAVGIYYAGEEYTAGFGITNIQHPLPVDAETLFQIASISKTFTGTAAMRLVDQGKLDLDTPVRTYLPDLKLSDPEATEKATLRHIFTHHGGWVGDYFGDFGRGEDALAKNVADLVNVPQVTPLGYTFSYNNAGFAIAGRIIEVITGKPFEEAVKELVLDPLGLAHTFYFAEDAIVHRVAVGHQIFFEENKPTEVLQPWALSRTSAALGGLVTNVKDLLRYARFQMGDGSWEGPDGQIIQLLKPQSIKTMQSEQAKAGSMAEEVGITWMLRQAGNIRVIGHGGASNGQMSILQIAPDQNFAIVVVTNATIGTNLCGEIVSWALEHFLEAPKEKVVYLDLASEKLEEYVGEYEAALSKATISMRDRQLFLQVRSKGGFPKPSSPPTPTPPEVRLAFTSKDQVVSLDYPFVGSKGDFLRNPDGSIGWFRSGGRIHKRLS